MPSDDTLGAPAEPREQYPINLKRAAELLHRTPRSLREYLRVLARQGIHCGRRSGKAIIFSERDFAALYDNLPQVDPVRESESRTVLTPSEAQDNRKLQQLRQELGPRAKGRRGKRDYLKDRSSPKVVLLPPKSEP